MWDKTSVTLYSVAGKADTIEDVLLRIRAIPGVEAAGFSRAGILIGESQSDSCRLRCAPAATLRPRLQP